MQYDIYLENKTLSIMKLNGLGNIVRLSATLALNPDMALDLLLGMAFQPRKNLILADSMLFWQKLAVFMIDYLFRAPRS